MNYKVAHTFWTIVFFLSLTLFISCSKPQEKARNYEQWHTVTLSFNGPETSENNPVNPFLNYRLQVVFQNGSTQRTIRGFYAADGNSAESSAESGSIWQVRFTPDQIGKWSYAATLQEGDSIALQDDLNVGKKISIENANGSFNVIPTNKKLPDFRSNGRLEAFNGFFKFQDSDKYWMKAGTNSPENLLAYVDFDDTYRIQAEAREGEATATDTIHKFEPHLQDWEDGDPTWKGGKGKSLIGALNYLASKGMNSVYFLTLNILGDGKDVWPYASPDDFTRFDVSKLEQWEAVFDHMQNKGLLLHLVLQETENETMLDNGDVGPTRQLYFRELIARFGHHLALVWNLGEENGPASWTPIGQDDAQRKEMAQFLKENDPYQHPVLLHTHSDSETRSEILPDILGFEYLDGLSFQQADREKTSEVVEAWKNKAKQANHEWLITMDEIGKWHTGAKTDLEDPDHETLRKYVLWGSLLSGAAGIEWYFGAKHPHNDLTSEDWRQRNRLWELTNHAKSFFDSHLPYWDMESKPTLVNSKDTYCLQKANEIYAVYVPDSEEYSLDLRNASSNFIVQWYNPIKGGKLQTGTISKIKGGTIQSLGLPPSGLGILENQDWVVLIKKQI